MPVFNTCAECFRKIAIHTPRDPRLARELLQSDWAICSDCDPASSWRRVIPKK